MKDYPKFSLVFILLLSFCIVKMARFDGATGEDWKYQFNSTDGKGYYAYLPEFFIKHDLAHQDPDAPYVNKSGNSYVNKYAIGTPLCWSPFFGAAWVYSKMTGVVCDGYSEPFKKAISYAGLVWLFIGLFALWKILEILGFSDLIISAILILIVFGTNLLYYAAVEPTMSHLYSFSVLSLFLLWAIRYFRDHSNKSLLYASLAFGLGTLIRPTNLILMIGLLPFAAGHMNNLREGMDPKRILKLVLPVVLVFAFLQCGSWYLQTGHWFVRTYVGEGFYFLHPQFWQVLFGFKKGWFIYTPLALLSLKGLVILFRNNRMAFYSITITLFLYTWLIASWWCWSFADSYGHRGFIDVYPVVAILLAYTFAFLPEYIQATVPFIGKKVMMVILGLLSLFCLGLNDVQTFQFCKHILHYNSMDWERYKYVFLKTDPRYIDCLGGCDDIQPYSRKTPETIFSSRNDFSKMLPEWKTVEPSKLGNTPCIHFNKLEYAAMLKVPTSKELLESEKLYVRMHLNRFEPGDNSSAGTLMVVDVTNSKNEHEFYEAFPINDEPSRKVASQKTYEYNLELPPLKSKDSHLAFYLWNQKKRDFYLLEWEVQIDRIYP